MSIEDRIQRLKGEKIEKSKKTGHRTTGVAGTSFDKRHNNGGNTNGGRKTSAEMAESRGLKNDAEEHYRGTIDVRVTDPATGRVKVMKKKRLLIVLEQLFKAAAEGDVDAANKWLDRALGKPAQPIEGNPDKPIMLTIDF